MQMRTCRTTGITTQTDYIAGTDKLVFGNELLGQVAVNSLKAVIMTDHDVFAITSTTLVLYDAHLAVESGTNGITHVYLDIQAVMSTSPARAITKGVIYLGTWGRHAETCKVECIAVWQHCVSVGIHELVVPRLIDI